jgi:hypothetical protein
VTNSRLRTLASSFLTLAIAGTVHAQTTTTTTTTPSTTTAAPASTSRTDRLFLSFAEEATLAESQWWEGQLEFQGGEVWDSTIARLVVAFQPFQNIELGGRVGFGSTSADGGVSDGTGGTDLDVWGKYRFDQGDTDFAAGALVTVPTGDDTAGLGRDAFDLELFGSVRHRAAGWIADGQAGVRFNGDGSVGGFDFNGDVSVFVGGGVIVPLSDVFSLVGELRLETARIDGGDDDARLLGGMHWRLGGGVVRAAAGFGLTDGAPDYQIIGGYAWVF